MTTDGITTGLIIAMISEAGKEAVLPLENNTSWMETLADKINAGQHIMVKIGEETILDRVIDGINDAGFTRNDTMIMI